MKNPYWIAWTRARLYWLASLLLLGLAVWRATR